MQMRSEPMARLMGLCRLDNLRLRIIGCGAMGLALGYVLQQQGHTPHHIAWRGGDLPPEIAVTLQSAGEGRYIPQAAQQGVVWDGTIFALRHDQVAAALAIFGQADGANLVICAHPIWNLRGAAMLFPHISAEICPMQGLGIVTGGIVDLAEGAPPALASLVQNLGFAAVRPKTLALFRGNALRIAASYAVILAYAQQILPPEDLTADLMRDVLGEFAALVQATGQHVQLPADQDRGFEVLCHYLKQAHLPQSGVLGQNLRVLMGPAQDKLKTHLAPYQPLWANRALPNCTKLSHRLLDDAFHHRVFA